MALVSSLAFACSKDDDDNTTLDIVGTWTADHIAYTAYVDDKVVLENKEEGDYSFRFDKDNKGEILSDKESFEYTLVGNVLTLYGTDSGADDEPLKFTAERKGNILTLVMDEKYVEDGKNIREVYRIELTKQ